jgi:hypothetical protein
VGGEERMVMKTEKRMWKNTIDSKHKSGQEHGL